MYIYMSGNLNVYYSAQMTRLYLYIIEVNICCLSQINTDQVRCSLPNLKTGKFSFTSQWLPGQLYWRAVPPWPFLVGWEGWSPLSLLFLWTSQLLINVSPLAASCLSAQSNRSSQQSCVSQSLKNGWQWLTIKLPFLFQFIC